MLALPVRAADPSPITFELQFDPKIRDTPFTGRVILFLTSDAMGEPRRQFDWTSRQPIFGQDVRDWKPGAPLRLTDPTGYPHRLKDLPAGKYRVQAVMHVNPDHPHSGTAPGNLYSKTVKATVDPAKSEVIKLHITRRVPEEKEPAQDGRRVRLRSACLSQFFGRDVYLRATVILPEEYEKEPKRRFPTIYLIPGFGGDDRMAGHFGRFLGSSKTPFVRIGLDATSPHGHHVFADSDNCGPCGRALVEELIPHLEKTYRLIAEPHARLLTGHSSGGWSCLWLQVAYPDYFGGTWSSAPDSVTFRDFCGIDLYDDKSNFLFDAAGKPRPIMRMGGQVVLTLPDFVRMEEALGPGGQMHSFEAVFGPRGADGRPRRLFDRESGRIDREVLKSWRRYDIVDKLEREWTTLRPKLRGKIHVLTGSEDNFYLEGATRLLAKSLERLEGAEADVRVIEGKDHFSVAMSGPYREMIGQMERKHAEAAGRKDAEEKSDE